MFNYFLDAPKPFIYIMVLRTFPILLVVHVLVLTSSLTTINRHNSGLMFDARIPTNALSTNVAFGRPTNSSGGHFNKSSLVVDGNTTANAARYCIHVEASTNNLTWWIVDLGSARQLHTINIYFGTDHKHTWSRNGIQVSVSNSTEIPSGINCYNVTGSPNGSDIDDTLYFPCSHTGQYVTLYTAVANGNNTAPVMDLCEVEVNVCSNGNYGEGCSRNCSARHCDWDKSATCDSVTGLCDCTAGYTGTDCTLGCTLGVRYGPNCKFNCSDRKCSKNSTCPTNTGQCDDGCRPGWTSVDCGEACSNTTYGYNCSRLCSNRHCNTSTSDSCEPNNGTCTVGCQPGWKGLDCTEPCPSNTYGHNCNLFCSIRHCNGSKSCEPTHGPCIDGCQSGWKGRDCTHSCSAGTEYGPNCAINCSTRMCSKNSTCPKDTGDCEDGCRPGWTATDCSIACTTNTYGHECSRLCSNRHCNGSKSDDCEPTTGTCIDGCQSGWKSLDCTERCSMGMEYGPNCAMNCRARMCSKISSCPMDTGQCEDGCRRGWTAMDCSEACPRDTYGPNCSLSCSNRHCSETKQNNSCEPIIGTCTDGCQSGWKGRDCTESARMDSDASTDTSTGTPGSLISGVIGASITAVVAILLNIMWCSIRRTRQKRREELSSKTFRI